MADLPIWERPDLAQLPALQESVEALEATGLVAHAPTGLAATDGPMIAELIGDTPEGGRAVLRNGLYALAGSPVINKHMTLEGVSVHPNHTPGGSTDQPVVQPYLKGSVLLQTQAGANGLTITKAGACVHLRNLGVQFDPALNFTNTGHGIEAVPSTNVGGLPDLGPMHGVWENIQVHGHDGNHYGWRVVNTLLQTLRHLRSYGGGGLEVVASSAGVNSGNLLAAHLYHKMTQAGTAHGISLRALQANKLNLLVFDRPQVNVAPAVDDTQYMFRADQDFPVHNITVQGHDFEAAAPGGNMVAFGSGVGLSVDPAGLITTTDVASKDWPVARKTRGDGSNRTSELRSKDMEVIRSRNPAVAPTATVHPGAGTGGSVGAVVTGDEFAGTIAVTTGAASTDDFARFVQIVFPAGTTYRPTHVSLTPIDYGASKLRPIVVTQANGFDLWTADVFPAVNTVHTWSYRCSPA